MPTANDDANQIEITCINGLVGQSHIETHRLTQLNPELLAKKKVT